MPFPSADVRQAAARLGLFLLVLATTVATPAFADTGAIVGRVTDTTGGALPGVAITALNAATGTTLTSQTDREGLYVIPSVLTGRYRVQAELQGFRSAVRNGVAVNVDTRVTVNFTLQVGDVTETLTVTGAPLLDTTTAGVSTLVDRQFVENLPINGRSFQTLLELTPGVVFTEATISNPGQFSVNGQRTNANYFLVDGVGANASTSASATSFQQAAGSLPNLTVFGGYTIYFPELYPTRLRSSGVGFCYNVGRIVAALGPFTLGGLTVFFSDAGYAAPFRAAAIALASIYLVGVIAMPFAPETKGKPLPQE